MKGFFEKGFMLALLLLSVAVCTASAAGFTEVFSLKDSGGIVALASAGVAIPSFDMSQLKAVSHEAFADLQAKYRRLYVVDVVIDEHESYQFILRRPSRDVIMLFSETTGAIKRGDIIIKNLVVAGNENNALDDGVVFNAFMAQAAGVLNDAQHFLYKA